MFPLLGTPSEGKFPEMEGIGSTGATDAEPESDPDADREGTNGANGKFPRSEG